MLLKSYLGNMLFFPIIWKLILVIVDLDKVSVLQGEVIKVFISHDNLHKYNHVQIEVYEVACLKVKYLLAAYAVMKGAEGKIFDIVVTDNTTTYATRFTYDNAYKGNLLTGAMTVEDPGRANTFLEALQNNPLDYFMVNLFGKALSEPNPEFQYVRFWGILNILAESQNYSPDEVLLDEKGSTILNLDGKPKTKYGELNVVYQLLLECDIPKKYEDVGVWYAFRCAVAHFGSIQNISKLRGETKKWAELGLEKLRQASGDDPILRELRHMTQVLIMRHLSQKKNYPTF